MKYAPLYNLIIRGYHKSWLIIHVSIYKLSRCGVATAARRSTASPRSSFRPCLLFYPLFSIGLLFPRFLQLFSPPRSRGFLSRCPAVFDARNSFLSFGSTDRFLAIYRCCIGSQAIFVSSSLSYVRITWWEDSLRCKQQKKRMKRGECWPFLLR